LGKLKKKQLRKLHAVDGLPHTQHAEMTIKDNNGKVQARVEMDVFGKKVPKSMMVK